MAELFEQFAAAAGISLDDLLAIPSGQVAAAAMPANISERDEELMREEADDESPEAIRRRIARKRRQQNAIAGFFMIEAGDKVDDLLSLVDRLETRVLESGYVRRTSEIDNNAFAGALKQTLQKQGLLAGSGRYQLEALLLEVDQPVFGLDFEVTTHVKYILTDRENNGAVVLNETIIAPYTATIGDAFAAIKRLRLANEGSGKANIQGLVEKLSELQIQPGNISLAQ